MISRSNCATESVSRPIELLVLKSCVTDTKLTPRFSTKDNRRVKSSSDSHRRQPGITNRRSAEVKRPVLPPEPAWRTQPQSCLLGRFRRPPPRPSAQISFRFRLQAPRSAETDAPDSKISSLLQTAPDSVLATPSSSAWLSVRFPSQVFRPPALLPPRERSFSESMNALSATESKSLPSLRMPSVDADPTRFRSGIDPQSPITASDFASNTAGDLLDLRLGMLARVALVRFQSV